MALIVVLWLVVLLSIMAAGHSRNVRTDTTLAARQVQSAKARALAEAGIVLLEPIMRLEITTPEEHLGDFVSDLQQRRAVITRTEPRGNITIIDEA